MRIFLSGGELFDVTRNEMHAFPSAGSLRKRPSNPRLHPSKSRREIRLQSWPSFESSFGAQHTNFHIFFSLIHEKLEQT